jgi:hypothetical protein
MMEFNFQVINEIQTVSHHQHLGRLAKAKIKITISDLALPAPGIQCSSIQAFPETGS